MKYRRGQHGISPSLLDAVGQVVEASHATAGDHRHAYRVGHGPGERQIEAVTGAVAIHRGEQDLPCPQRGCGDGPRDHVVSGWGASPVQENLPTFAVGSSFCVDCDHDALGTELGREVGDQLGSLHRCGVDRDLVSPGAQHHAGIVDTANAAADSEGDEHLLGGSPHHIDHRVAVIGRRRYVEEDELVRAFRVIAGSQLHRVAGVSDVDEAHTLDDPSTVDIETGNDSGSAHPATLPSNTSSMSTENELTPTDDMSEIERRLAMPLVEAIVTQRSIRRIHPDPVSPAIVRRLIELGLEGPTGSNAQNWEFIVVTDHEIKERLAKQYRRAWKLYGGLGKRLRTDDQTKRVLKSVQWQVERFAATPVLVVPCLQGGSRPPIIPMPAIADSSHYGSIYPSVQNLLLGARAIGLGASLVTLPLWSGIASRHILGLPLSVEPTCVVALGWPIGRYGTKARKPVDEVIHFDRWNGTK